MAKIIDLDAFMPDDIEVKLNGKTWLVPGDLDVTMMIKMFKYQESEDPKVQMKIIDLFIDLFRQRHTEEEIENLHLSFKQAGQLLVGIVSTIKGDSEKNATSQEE